MRHATALVWSCSTALGLALGCSSYTVPQTKLVASEAAVRGAREVGAEKYPEASLYLKLAQEQIEQAKAMIKDKDERANTFLMRAHADAELALASAREETTRAQAQQTMDQVNALKKQNGTM